VQIGRRVAEEHGETAVLRVPSEAIVPIHLPDIVSQSAKPNINDNPKSSTVGKTSRPLHRVYKGNYMCVCPHDSAQVLLISKNNLLAVVRTPYSETLMVHNGKDQ
jgi:hypothetical protein